MTQQDTLPLSDDDREAHQYYLRCPPRRSRDPADELYWRGLVVDLMRGVREQRKGERC